MSGCASVIVIGNGMVGHRFVELMSERDGGDRGAHALTTFCEEPRLAYDRVNLSAYFAGKGADELALARLDRYRDAGVTVHVGDKAVAIDRAARTVRSQAGRTVAYDKLVLATGSYPFVPPIRGNRSRGCFVYRTLEDLDAIRDSAAHARVGVVIGGGLLGLEAANALLHLGLDVHVVEFAPRLMSLQVDEVGGALLRQRIEGLGVHVRTGTSTTEIVAGDDGSVAALRFSDGSELAADLVVFSAGIRPRDELARECGLAIGDRGGVVVDDRCQTSDPDIFAIGECALHDGRTYGLVAPGYRMARVVADVLGGADRERFCAPDLGTKLKLLGVDVASFGDAFAATPGARLVSFFDGNAAVYKKLVLSPDGARLLGGILVGDAAAYGQLHPIAEHGLPLPPHPEELILPPRDGAPPAGRGVDALPAAATICSCLNVTKGAICDAIVGGKLGSVAAVKACTRAGTGCGSCTTLIGDLVKHELARAGVAVVNHVCEHFPYSRQELYHLVRLHGVHSFAALLAQH
ncbi:MAG TPA: nitrite reductase large subunit NirB, partial [Polyangia bacterium]